jgi:Flp pilus assembly protein TadD
MPSSWKALQTQAAQQLARGELSEAAHSLVEAIELEPREPALYELLIRVTLLGGSTGTAVSAATELRRIDGLNHTYAYLHGVALLADGKVEQADTVLQEARTRAPNSLDVLQALAQVATAKSDVPRALELLDQAWRRAPTDIDVTVAYSTMLLAAKRPSDAREVLLKAAATHPTDGTLQLNLALTSLRVGDKVAARQHALRAAQSTDQKLRDDAQQLVVSLTPRP